jgi:hypothetical protein
MQCWSSTGPAGLLPLPRRRQPGMARVGTPAPFGSPQLGWPARSAGPLPSPRTWPPRGSVWMAGRTPVPLQGAPPTWFSQIYILSVAKPVQYGSELLLSWTSNAPAGLVFQVYLNQQLVWNGSSTRCSIPLPAIVARIDIGMVGVANRTVSYASSLAPSPDRQVVLNWLGGTYEGADLAGFHVYGEHAAGHGIDFAEVLGTVSAYTAGIFTDGFGYGGFGYGGFGAASGAYSWTSAPLASGTWQWGVKPFDVAGNEGPAQTAAVGVTAPSLPPAPFPDRTRLHYAYSPGSKKATLSWNASRG